MPLSSSSSPLPSHPGVFNVPVQHIIMVYNSAGSTQANSTLLPPPEPTLGTPDVTPYGPFTLSQLIALLIGVVCLLLVVSVLLCALPAVVRSRRKKEMKEEKFLAEDFAAEFEEVVSDLEHSLPPVPLSVPVTAVRRRNQQWRSVRRFLILLLSPREEHSVPSSLQVARASGSVT